jgi:ABC-2 type transport system permease protein
MSDRAVFSLQRTGAMVLRYYYLLRSSWPRMFEMMYWPTVQLLTWGFLQTYLATLIGAVLLWDILLRGQQGFSFSFLEEMWSRNIANLMMSPLRPAEFIAAMMTISLIRLFVAMIPVTILAILFFGFNLWSLGAALAAFFAVLIFFAWSVGLLVSGLILRFGLGAENFAWSLMFLIQPLGCVYYPVAILPYWLQVICWTLPPTYVFEGMRGVLIDHVFHAELMAQGFALSALYFAAAAFAFSRLLISARRAGSLLQTGE